MSGTFHRAFYSNNLEIHSDNLMSGATYTKKAPLCRNKGERHMQTTINEYAKAFMVQPSAQP
jgi:hypothetical protein